MKNLNTRRIEAQKRQEEYDKLTTSQKILKLNLLYGEGKGATKERKRLAELLIEESKGIVTKTNTGEIPSGVGNSIKKKPYQKPKKS